MLLAAQEIRQQDKRNAVSTNISAKRLADFIAAVQEHETLLMQRLRDLEAVGMLENVTPNTEGVPQCGVGKTTMIRQIAKRLNENVAEQLPGVSNSLSYRNGSQPPMPLLLLETRPPDGGVFNPCRLLPHCAETFGRTIL